jgi:flagellar biosynthesis protein FlhF
MRLKLFRAPTMADAMAQVRVELGDDALILNTKLVHGGVEVTAALEPEPEPIQHADGHLEALTWHGVPLELRAALANGNLEGAVAGTLRFGSLPLTSDQAPIMLTGPPGAGKTLTAVRLATRLVMGGDKPMVITTDGKRAGATEQLAAFTRLLGIPLLVASHAASLARALAQRQNGAPVLIDTAGTDPREPDEAADLKSLATLTDAHLALVLPAGLDPSESAELAAAHAECGAISLVATRLDVARRLGGIVAAAMSGLVLTEAGIGCGAADGLTPLTPELLATRLRHYAGNK